MHIFVSGIGGTDLGLLATIDKGADCSASGSEPKEGAHLLNLKHRDVNMASEQMCYE
ncbi:hypothetical protein FWF93_02315 [Candidatus Saccharibacteria bacterium]|nr:hypothetical protein [Candidatus Saccharibacteria bacterium]